MLAAEHIKSNVLYAFRSCTQFEVETRHSSYEAVVFAQNREFWDARESWYAWTVVPLGLEVMEENDNDTTNNGFAALSVKAWVNIYIR